MGSIHRAAKTKASIKGKKNLLSLHFECILLFQSRHSHSTITGVKFHVQGSFVRGLCTKFQDIRVVRNFTNQTKMQKCLKIQETCMVFLQDDTIDIIEEPIPILILNVN